MNESANIHVGKVRCRRCSKWRHPADIIGGAFGFCPACFERHKKAMEIMNGQTPAYCQECGVTTAELAEQQQRSDISMQMHAKDGILEILCPRCGDAYSKKRRDLYANTPFGETLDLNA